MTIISDRTFNYRIITPSLLVGKKNHCIHMPLTLEMLFLKKKKKKKEKNFFFFGEKKNIKEERKRRKKNKGEINRSEGMCGFAEE